MVSSRAGIDPNLRGQHGFSPLYVAANNGKDECVALMVEDERVDVNCVDHKGDFPLLSACTFFATAIGQMGTECGESLDHRKSVYVVQTVSYSSIIFSVWRSMQLHIHTCTRVVPHFILHMTCVTHFILIHISIHRYGGWADARRTRPRAVSRATPSFEARQCPGAVPGGAASTAAFALCISS